MMLQVLSLFLLLLKGLLVAKLVKFDPELIVPFLD